MFFKAMPVSRVFCKNYDGEEMLENTRVGHEEGGFMKVMSSNKMHKSILRYARIMLYECEMLSRKLKQQEWLQAVSCTIMWLKQEINCIRHVHDLTTQAAFET